MDKFFKISERGSNVRTEIVGGIVTFFSMAYIIFVNPNYLSAAGMNWHAVMLATCISAAIGCFLTAMLANVPFAQAPGMGLNAFFTYTVCLGMGYTWQEALAIVLLSGILFLVIAVSPLRSKIISSIPGFLKSAISAGIGLFIAFIGLQNAKIVVDSATLVSVYSFKNSIEAGKFSSEGITVLLALVGILVMAALLVKNIKGNILWGILITWALGILCELTGLIPA